MGNYIWRKVRETSNMGSLIQLLRNQVNRLNQLPWIKSCQAEGVVKGLSVGTVSAGQGGGREDKAFKQKQRGADKTQRAKVQATGKGPRHGWN